MVSGHAEGEECGVRGRRSGAGSVLGILMQNPSFLENQRLMKENMRRNIAEHLFRLQSTPSDNEIRDLPDPVSPDGLNGMYRWVFEELDGGKSCGECVYMGTICWWVPGTVT